MPDLQAPRITPGQLVPVSRKMTESQPRLAVSTRTRRAVTASALLTSDRIGVRPLSAPNATIGAAVSRRQNTPAGRVTSTTSPGLR